MFVKGYFLDFAAFLEGCPLLVSFGLLELRFLYFCLEHVNISLPRSKSSLNVSGKLLVAPNGDDAL